MPRIPAYHPEERAHLHPLQSDANPQAGVAAGQAAGIMGEFARRLDEARLRKSIADAQNYVLQQTTQLRDQVQESSDWHNGEADYDKGFEKIRAGLHKQYPGVAAKVQPTLDRAGIVGRHSVRTWAWGKEQAQARADLYTDVKRNTAAMVNATTPEERQMYRDQIAHDTAAAANNFVTPLQADRIRDGAYSGADKARAEQLIEKDPAQAVAALSDNKQFADLDPETRIALQHRAERQVHLAQSAARAHLVSQSDDDLSSIQHTGQGIADFDERMAAAGFTAEQIAAHKEKQQMALTVYHAAQGVKTDTEQQMRERVAAMKPEPGDPEYRAKFELYTHMQTAVDKELEHRHADPAGYAVSVHKPTADNLEGQIDQILGQETALGIPEADQKPLPKDMAQGMLKQWHDAAPDEKVALVSQWQQESGKHFQAVFRQLMGAGLPIGAGVMLHVSSDVRDDMAQALGMKMSDLKKSSGNPASLSDEVAQDIKPFLRTLPPDIHIRGEYLQLAHRMSLFYAARGDDHPAQEAVDNLYGNYFSYVGTLRVPKGRGYDPNKIANYGDWVLKHLDGHDLNDRGQPPMFFAERAYHEGHWITDTDGNSATLYIDHAPVTYKDGTAQAGKPVKLYFDHAAGFDYAAHAEPGKGHLANPESHGFIGGTPSPLAYKGAPLVPESHMKSDEQNSVSGMGNGQVNAGGKAPPPSPPGSALPWLRKLAQWTEPNSAAFQLLKRLIEDAEGKKAKGKTK